MPRLYIKTFGKYKTMTAVLHVLYCHGHLYLEWAEEVVGVPLGALSESAIECHNKDKKRAKRYARLDSVAHNSADTMHSSTWTSDPLVLAFKEVIQVKKRGNARKLKAK